MRSSRAPQVINLHDRRADVARLRRAGLTLEQIAQRVGVSKRTVISDLDHTLTTLHEIANEHLDSWRSAQLVELQQIRDRIWAALNDLTTPDRVPSLVNAFLRAQEREAKLLGLDAAPLRPRVTVERFDTMTDEEANRILAELGDL